MSTHLNLACAGCSGEAPFGNRLGGDCCCWGVGKKFWMAGNIILLLLLGLFANLTTIGSVPFFGIVPFSSAMARSASDRWSYRIKPTPFEKPLDGQRIKLH